MFMEPVNYIRQVFFSLLRLSDSVFPVNILPKKKKKGRNLKLKKIPFLNFVTIANASKSINGDQLIN